MRNLLVFLMVLGFVFVLNTNGEVQAVNNDTQAVDFDDDDLPDLVFVDFDDDDLPDLVFI